MTKSTKDTQGKPKSSPDKLTKIGDKSGVTLTEKDLERVTGGAGQAGTFKKID